MLIVILNTVLPTVFLCSPQVLRPYSNLSNLKIWDYYLTEDLAHGPSYDIEVTQREIRQNEDQEPVETIGQPRRKVVNGCYDNILIQQPDNFQWQFQVGDFCRRNKWASSLDKLSSTRFD